MSTHLFFSLVSVTLNNVVTSLLLNTEVSANVSDGRSCHHSTGSGLLGEISLEFHPILGSDIVFRYLLKKLL